MIISVHATMWPILQMNIPDSYGKNTLVAYDALKKWAPNVFYIAAPTGVIISLRAADVEQPHKVFTPVLVCFSVVCWQHVYIFTMPLEWFSNVFGHTNIQS